jgi:hypothetical protein
MKKVENEKETRKNDGEKKDSTSGILVTHPLHSHLGMQLKWNELRLRFQKPQLSPSEHNTSFQRIKCAGSPIKRYIFV